jgi:Pyridoxamine 5'-phosphate oxidase
MASAREDAYEDGHMSIPVALERLRAAVEERGPSAYVLTVSDDGRPHAVHGPVRWIDEVLVADVGRRSAANATARPSVSLLYPVRTDGEYTLIVDGTAAVESSGEGLRLLVTPTTAVLHRPAPAADPTASSCAADCLPLFGGRV